MPRVRSASARLQPIGMALALLLALSASAAEEPSATDRIPIPRGERYRDATVKAKDLSHHDLVEVFVSPEKGQLHLWVRMQRPLIESVATGVDVYVDCDDKASTGVNGSELHVRASIGSRTRPNRAPSRGPGLPPAIGLRRAAYAVLYDGDKVGGKSFLWSNEDRVSLPLIRDRFLYFSFPLALLKENGLRYNDTVRFSVHVDGVIAENPIWLEVLCDDEGLPILVDGRADDWAGGAKTKDETGELHPIVGHLDLRELQVDHDAEHLFVLATFAEPGFANLARAGRRARRGGLPGVPELPDLPDLPGLPGLPGVPRPPRRPTRPRRPEVRVSGDIQVRDHLMVVVEPLGSGAYMKLREVRIPCTVPVARGEETAWHVEGAVAEVKLTRPPAQTRFRVHVWSEALRRDFLGEGRLRLRIPSGAWKAR